MKKRLSIVYIFLFYSLCMYAQDENKADTTYQYLLRGVVIDSIDAQTIPGALVSAIFNTDTLHAITDLNGLFILKTQVQPKRMEITVLGYKIAHVKTGKTSSIQDYGFIRMTNRDYALDEVKVTARLKKVVYRGDTVQFNANAFKMNRFATAGQLLSRMPGISVDQHGIVKYNGEYIAQAYIDGKKVFGEGYDNLLKHLEASDVKTVDVYKELSEMDKHLGNENAQKRVVLNFKTFSKLISATVGHATAGYGGDEHRNIEGKKQERYAAGLTANFFSDIQSFQLNVFGNNVNRQSNTLEDVASTPPLNPGYNRLNVVSIRGYKNIKRFAIHDIGYNYEEQYSNNLGRSKQRYTPTELFNSRIVADSSFRKSKTRIHNFGISGSWVPNKVYIYYSFNTSLRNSDGYSTMASSVDKDNALISRINSVRKSDNNGISGDYRIDVTYRKNSKVEMSLDTRFSFNRDKGDGLKLDTAFQSSNYNYINVTTDNKATKYNLDITPRIGYNITPRIKTYFRLGLDKMRSNSRQYTIDNYTSEIDPGQTYDYINNSETLTPNIAIDYRKRNHSLSASVTGQLAWQKQEDEIIGITSMPTKRFFAPLFSFAYILNNAFNMQSGKFQIQYTTQAQIPGANMLRHTIDNTNPLYLKAGNRNLKQTYTHSIRSHLAWMKDEQSFLFLLSGNYMRNSIAANKTIFYDSETILPEYNDFKVLPGSTLSTYDNIKEKYTIGIGANYDRPADIIESLVKVGLGYSYSYEPSYIGTEFIKSYYHIPNARINIITNISTDYEIRWGYNFTYRDINRSNDTKDRLLSHQLNLSFDASLFDDFLSVKTSYIARFNKNIDFRVNDFSSHVLNLTAGFRLFKRKNGEVNFGIFDILNKNRSFVTKANSEYLSNTWSHVSGRYAMINFSYRFNIKKSQNKKINPGDYNSIINSATDNY